MSKSPPIKLPFTFWDRLCSAVGRSSDLSTPEEIVQAVEKLGAAKRVAGSQDAAERGKR